MKKARILCALLLCIFSKVSAQHSLQLDAGDGKYAYIVAPPSLPVGATIFTLDSLSSTIVTDNNIGEYAWILGGNNAPPSNQLGTTSADDLDIITNSSRRMRIASGGNVQIGTGATPNLFEVDGATGNLKKIENVDNYDWPNAHMAGFLRNNGSGGLSWVTNTFTDRAGIGTWYKQPLGNNGSGAVDVSGTTIQFIAVPFGGTITGLSVVTTAAVGVGGTLNVNLTKNGATVGGTTVTLTAGESFDYSGTLNVSFSAGDRIGIEYSSSSVGGSIGALGTVFATF